MADIVRDTLDKSVRQRKVIFQQKKPLLNYELNLAQDILRENAEDFTRFSIGDNYYGDSLKIEPGTLTNEIFIRKGTFYHQGVPVSMTADKRMFVGSPPSSGTRYDVVYATWKITQVDSSADPVIGFVTTQENRVEMDIVLEENTKVPTALQDETITFDAGTNTITLQNGYFPDWMRIPDLEFKTNALNNNGSPFFTVVDSPDNKTVVVAEALSNQVAKDVRFTEYRSSLEIPREFRAYRENYIVLAVLERVNGIFVLRPEDIHDQRDRMAYNFVVEGCAPFKDPLLGPLDLSLTPGEFFVGDDQEFLETALDHDTTVLDDAFSYVYLSTSGTLETDTTEPTDFHVMIAEVQAESGSIREFKDVRQFRPISWSNKYGQGGGDGHTGFNTVTHDFIAGEAISAYEAVFMDSDGKVKRATASDKSKLPVVALAVQNTAAEQKNTFVTFGIVSNSAWSWTAGEDVFVDLASGALTGSAGVTSIGDQQYVHRVGVAMSSTELFVKPDLNYIKKDVTAEIPIVTVRENGDLEVMGPDDRLSPDRLSFLAVIDLDPVDQGIEILPGRYYVEGNEAIAFAGQVINMGTTGTTYQTTAIPSGYYNKALFTLDKDGVVQMYEGVASASVPSDDPEIPDNEIPLAVVVFRDDGSAGAGTILNIAQGDITDKRPWLNIVDFDGSAFKAFYRSEDEVLISAGEAWFSKDYVTLAQNEVISVSTADGSYYVYLDLNNTTGSGTNIIASNSSFTSTTLSPSQVDRRKFIPLAEYTVSGGVIDRSSFRTYKSKYWDFRDAPFFGEQVFSVTGSTSGFTVTNFNFLDEDYLEVTLNGVDVFETDDYTKDGVANTVTFSYNILTGAELRIRKV